MSNSLSKTSRLTHSDSASEMPSKKPQANSLRRSLLFVFLLFLFLFLWKLVQNPPDFLLNEDQRFTRFTEGVFCSEMNGSTISRHYTLANPEKYKINTDLISLGDASPAARKKAAAVMENYRNTMLQFDRSKLSEQHQLTYDIFLNHLETELSAAHLFLYEEPLSPTLGVQAQLPILLAEYTFRTKGDIEDYLCLLTRIPDYFSSILAFEQEKASSGLFMSNTCADEVILQCQEFIHNPESNYLISIFDEKIDGIKNLTVDEKIAYKTRNKSILLGYVVPAYEKLIAGINKLEGSGTNDKGLYYLPEGQNYYRYLVKSMTGDSRSLEEIEEAIKVQMVEDFSEIQMLMKQDNSDTQTQTESQTSETTANLNATASAQIHTGYTASQTTEFNTSAAAPSGGNPAAMLEDLRQKITRDFPLPPAVSCRIKYVHTSLQEHLSPAFYLTPAIDDYKNNVIYINPASDYDNLELYTTLAHEGYPGHLYQSVYFTATQPDLLRNLLDVGGYTEGWATYVEMYSYSLWGNDSSTAISQHNRSFTLGLASLMDIGIHYRGYSLADVTAFLEKLGFSGDTAKSFYHTILQAPANYLQYFVGYLNFCELRDWQKERLQSQFSLKEFHKKILEIGPAPFEIIKNQME